MKVSKLPEPKISPIDIPVTYGRVIYFPDNEKENGKGMYGIKTGYYSEIDIVSMLRALKNNPAAVQYIADMLE